jgi:hypothetical protein
VEKTINLNEAPKRLFLDLSSSCSGYAIASFTTVEGAPLCTIHRAGAIWFDDKWDHGQKYHYIVSRIMEEFHVQDGIVEIIYEKYSVSFSQRAGCLVVPEMIGAIKCATKDVLGTAIGIEDFAPQSWRKELGIKPLVVDGKRDYKTPVKNAINEIFPLQVPQQIQSNITNKLRSTPHDLYDALGICIGWHKKLGVHAFSLDINAFNEGVLSHEELFK